MKPVGVAVAGLGDLSRYLLPVLKSSASFDLRACYDPDAARCRDAARAHGCAAAASYEACLADPAVEAVLLLTPNALHAEQAVAAARARRHVFVEKPMARSVSEADAMISARDAAGVVLAVGHDFRLGGPVRALCGAAREGRLGRILLAEAAFTRAAGLALPAGHWKLDPEACPGGPLAQLGSHLVELLLHLLGPVASVQAFAERRVLPGGNPDSVLVALRFAGGALASVACGYAVGEARRVSLYGTEANLHLAQAGEGPAELVLERPGRHEALAIPETDPLAEKLEAFAASIRHGSPPLVGAEEGREVMRVLDAAMASAEGGRPFSP